MDTVNDTLPFVLYAAAFVLGLLGAAARWLQGNGQGAIGRTSLVLVTVFAAWLGPLDAMAGLPRSIDEILLVAGVAAMAAGLSINLLWGKTRWESIPYSLVRYFVPPAIGTAAYVVVSFDLYAIAIPFAVSLVTTAAYHGLAYKRPRSLNVDWNDDGEVDDVAAIPAGFIAVYGMALL